MSDLVILKAVEAKVRAIPGLPPIQSDNTTVASLPRIELYLLPGPSRIAGFGAGATYEDSGIIQLSLCYAPGIGSGALLATAEQLKSAFNGWAISSAGVHIRTPQRGVLGPAIDGDGDYRRALSIRYQAFTSGD